MTEAPKCEDCWSSVPHGTNLGCTSYWDDQIGIVPVAIERLIGHCDPKGIKFQPKKPEWPKALTVGAVRGSVIKPKEGKRDA